MDTTQPLDKGLGINLNIDNDVKDYLSQTAKWAKFLAILGFIFIGMMIVFGVFAAVFMNMMSGLNESPSADVFGAIGTTAISFMYIFFGLIYFFPVLYLYRFSTSMQRALRSNDQDELNTAFKNLKGHYKYIGVMMAVIIGMYILGIIAAFIGGLLMV